MINTNSFVIRLRFAHRYCRLLDIRMRTCVATGVCIVKCASATVSDGTVAFFFDLTLPICCCSSEMATVQHSHLVECVLFVVVFEFVRLHYVLRSMRIRVHFYFCHPYRISRALSLSMTDKRFSLLSHASTKKCNQLNHMYCRVQFERKKNDRD